MVTKEDKYDLNLWLAQDYDIKEETESYYLMQKKTATVGGHILIFLFTFWFTLGIGNILYHFLAVKKRKVMKNTR